MSTKRISVNPDFFNMGGKRKTKKKLSHSLRTNFNSLQKNMLKDKMINKIKEFKKKQKKKKNIDKSDDDFQNEYKDAMDFMEDVIKKKSKKTRKRRRKNSENIETNPINQTNINYKKNNINLSANAISANAISANAISANAIEENTNIKKDPPYGILKNGNKMLYSKYRKSFKNNSTIDFKPHKTSQVKENNILVFTDENNFGKEINIDFVKPPVSENNIVRKNKLDALKESFMAKNGNPKKDKKNEKFKVKNKKIIKRFKLGKNAKTNKIAVLIKNKKTRRLINKDCKFLKKKKLKQIKSVLVKNALIKVGTQAPENLLREMYINRYLAGDIKNSGGKNAEEILMHNWNSESN